MSTIGFVVNEARPEALALAGELAHWVAEQGHTARLTETDSGPDVLDGVDVLVSLGGDGTILRTVDLAGRRTIPVLGINLGQLGYLTQVEPDQARAAMGRVLAGDYEIDERMMLQVELVRHGRADDAPALEALALNEAVLEKTLSGHTVRLEVRLDGDLFTPYEADALIVATPTGSTAYAFSARGPIIAPSHRALLLTPVSPHMLFDRSLVLGPDTEISLTVNGGRSATLTVDGRVLAEVHDGDTLRCRASTHVARLVELGHRDFHRILKSKFGLSDR